jgi:cell division protein FtsB
VIRNVEGTVHKVLADTHVPPALRRWGTRLGLAVVVAVLLGYLPGQMLRRDPRTVKLRAQLEQLDNEARELAVGNAALMRDIEALRTDVGAIEDRARADLGMVYPDEIVLEIKP